MKFLVTFATIAATLCISCSSKDSQTDVKESKNDYTAPQMGEMTDARDGKKYKTVKIGDQIWMAENLAFEYKVKGLPYGNVCNKDECKTYGRYYSWAAAMDSVGIYSRDGEGCGYGIGKCPQKTPIRGICPENWHLPDSTEWITLIKTLRDFDNSSSLSSLSGEKAHAIMATGYGKGCYHEMEEEWGKATNISGFSAIPAGYYLSSEGAFHELCENVVANLFAIYWSSTISPTTWLEHAYTFVVTGSLAHLSSGNRDRMNNVRCIKDEKPRIVDKAEADYFKAKAEAHAKLPTMEGPIKIPTERDIEAEGDLSAADVVETVRRYISGLRELYDENKKGDPNFSYEGTITLKLTFCADGTGMPQNVSIVSTPTSALTGQIDFRGLNGEILRAVHGWHFKRLYSESDNSSTVATVIIPFTFSEKNEELEADAENSEEDGDEEISHDNGADEEEDN